MQIMQQGKRKSTKKIFKLEIKHQEQNINNHNKETFWLQNYVNRFVELSGNDGLKSYIHNFKL